MKKNKAILCILMIMTFAVLLMGNMAAPKEADIGSGITFEKNDKLAVLSEVLDITVSGTQAAIVATYKMQNITSESVSTSAMFLSPNVAANGTKVVVDDINIDFSVQTYAFNYCTQVETEDWRYVVLNDYEDDDFYGEVRSVDAITFQMDFEPNEVYDVVLSYNYSLGGYPNYYYNAKNGVIEYYLTPAAMWQNFGEITINLYLDKDMPIIRNSNLDFVKVDKRVYRYHSDTLPEENLRITIDENGWQNVISTLRSPYLWTTLMFVLPILAILIVIIVVVIVIVVKKKRKKRRIKNLEQGKTN